jgi:hypothetical protein
MERFSTWEGAFAYYTECALATAEGLDMLKSASQSSKGRAWSIALGMVEHYERLGGGPILNGHRLPRLKKRMDQAAAAEALDA